MDTHEVHKKFEKEGLPFIKKVIPLYPSVGLPFRAKQFALGLNNLAEVAEAKGLEVEISDLVQVDKYRSNPSYRLWRAWKIVRVKLKPAKLRRVEINNGYLQSALGVDLSRSQPMYHTQERMEIIDRDNRHPHATRLANIPGSGSGVRRICYRHRLKNDITELNSEQALVKAAVILATHSKGWIPGYALLGRPVCKNCKTWMDPEVYNLNSYTLCARCGDAICMECAIDGKEYHHLIANKRFCSVRCAKLVQRMAEYAEHQGEADGRGFATNLRY